MIDVQLMGLLNATLQAATLLFIAAIALFASSTEASNAEGKAFLEENLTT